MPLYYITGISGAGKSTVLSELNHRGYEAYDVDVAGPVTAKWHNNTTGYVHPKSSIKKEARTEEFLANHTWRVSRQEVVTLARHAETKPIFVGGAIANETELRDLFGAVFALAIDDDTLTRRLTARTNNDWGKSPHEMQLSLTVNHELDARYRKLDYIVIDASQTTDMVVDEILGNVHDN